MTFLWEMSRGVPPMAGGRGGPPAQRFRFPSKTDEKQLVLTLSSSGPSAALPCSHTYAIACRAR
eukprot:942833-Karenia_brevis.AAC.1